MSNKKRTRKSEIALLERLSTSLDTYIKAPDQEQVLSYCGDNGQSTLRIASADASKDASKNVLATKTLIKNIARVVFKERSKATELKKAAKKEGEGEEAGGEDVTQEIEEFTDKLIEGIIEEYQDNYPTVSVDKVKEALGRYVPPEKGDEEEEDDEDDDDDDDDDFERITWHCIAKVDEDMDKYFEKIAALKKNRESLSAEADKPPPPKKKKGPRGRPKKVKTEEGENPSEDNLTPSGEKKKKTYKKRKVPNTPEQELIDEVVKRYTQERESCDRLQPGGFENLVNQARQDMGMEDLEISNERIIKRVEYEFHKAKQPPKERKPREPRKTGRKDLDTPEGQLINEIATRYSRERETLNRIPTGMFEEIVDQTKRDLGMEDYEPDMRKLHKRVARIRILYFPEEEVDAEKVLSGEITDRHKREKVLFDEVYARYSSEKVAHGGQLPIGSLDAIINKAKKEFNMEDIELNKQRIRGRFKRSHPEFANNHSSIPEITKLDEEKRKRRQLLLNEVTARYVAEKESHPAKLPDGTLDLIIETTKNDLGIMDVDVPKDTIRGRIARKSLYVRTLGSESPYNVIDDPLVQTINNWLGEGISVTRAMGLELANSLLKGKNLKTDENGQPVLVDAKWWRNFLERNKRRLICAANDTA